jgi:hypothetical protein
MSRFFTLFFSAIIFITNAQTGYQIRIKTENINADSLFVKEYHVKSKKFTPFLALKFEKDITIKDKTPLKAGIYIIEADSTTLTEFLISDHKNQKFTFTFLKDDIMIEGSKENSANRMYMKKIFHYNNQITALENELIQLQQSGLPQYMKQTSMDSLYAQYNRINHYKRVYQKPVVDENKGLLLASIILGTLEPPSPPQEILRDRVKYYTFTTQHLFDSFPWEDERILNTPIAYNMFKSFAQQIFQLESVFSIPIVIKILNESKKNRAIYYALFDYLEHEFGSIKSLYRDELLYIAMLKDILIMHDLDETRKQRYEYEMKIIDKNHEGSLAPDFHILWADGDTTMMYDIDAELLMLYFQNPDCPTCSDIREKMKNMSVVNEAIASGKLKVVTIYFEANEDLWRNYLNTRALKNWEHGWNFDLSIPEKRLYDTRTIPMMMFLDKNKKIIKKDILWNEIEDWLKRYL